MLKTLRCCRSFLVTRCYAKGVEEMKYLNVAEKNDAAKTIAGQLSNGTARRREGYSVYNKIYEFEANVRGVKSKMVMTSVSGHLLELEFLNSYRNWKNVDPQALFEAPIRKTCSENYEPIKRTLEREIRGCQGLIIWTDCDREGENIGFEIIDVCRAVKPNISVYRAIFSEITGAAVRRALQQLTTPDKRQSDAVDVRSELDLRTGASITRFQTMRLQRLFPQKIADKLISYGSCQIPTLGFVVERYKEIEAFVSEPFWKIKVIHTIGDLSVEFLWARNRLFDKQACEDYYLLCLANPKATVENVSVKPKSKWRPTPMDTVEMEKLGSRKLKMSAKEVMTIAEKLYSKGMISYPRTETNMFSKEIDLRSLVEQQTSHGVWGSFAQRVMEWGPNPRNGNKSDQAHPPIHPTKLVTNLEGNEARVYELICRHFLACVSKDATGSETIVNINIEGEKFTATGLCIYERNYLDVYIYDKWNAKQIHKYEQGQVFEPTEISMVEGATTAPPLLTEADLIALMEKHGIGTDATHAEHINTIKERGYIGVVDKGHLVPGVIGMGLYEGYDAMELSLAKPVLRAQFEADLKLICRGEKDPKIVLREQIQKYKEAYKQIMDKITAMDEKMSQRINETPAVNSSGTSYEDTENSGNRMQELFDCPKCGVAPLALKPKKNQSGYMIGCLNYPDCKNVIWLPEECKEPRVLEETCRKCGDRVKLLKFKFQSAYHKTLFNAPTGWYKMCLRCDSLFRDTFNINLDTVKRVGAIVSDRIEEPTVVPGDSGGRISRPVTQNNAGKTTKTKKSKSSGGEVVARKPRNKPSTSATTTSSSTENNNIRSYFTSASSSRQEERGQSAEDIAAAELQDIPLDALFDSNDSFRDILATEANTATNSGNSQRQNPENPEYVNNNELSAFGWGSGNQRRNENSFQNTNRVELDDSFAALFSNDNNFSEDDYVWGSAARRARLSQIPEPAPASKRPCLQMDDNQVDDILQRYGPNVKCSGCHQEAKELRVKKDGPNKGRVFYVCAKSNPCKFFQWADELSQNTSTSTSTSETNPNSGRGRNSNSHNWNSEPNRFNADPSDETEPIKCNCGVPASSLTVRKEGPNKGRAFYACHNRDNSCGFFKWGDEGDNQGFPSSSWGSSSRSAANSNAPSGHSKGSSSGGGENKKRKCGLCRQEGHTRAKCPRKAEFEF